MLVLPNTENPFILCEVQYVLESLLLLNPIVSNSRMTFYLWVNNNAYQDERRLMAKVKQRYNFDKTITHSVDVHSSPKNISTVRFLLFHGIDRDLNACSQLSL